MENPSTQVTPGDASIADDVLVRVFARIDRLALGVAVGIVAGAVVFLATIILVIKGGDPIGPTLGLLGQYIPGYTVSWSGSLIGGVGGFAGGFAIGWMIAFLRNFVIATYFHVSSFWMRLNRFLDD